MQNLTVSEAARFVDTTRYWLQWLIDNEYLVSTCRDELEIYMEKAPLMHDYEFAEQAHDVFLRV